MKHIARIIADLARELGVTPFDIINDLAGMSLTTEQANDLKSYF